MGLILAVFVAWILGIGIVIFGMLLDPRRNRRPGIPNVERLGVSGSVRRAP